MSGKRTCSLVMLAVVVSLLGYALPVLGARPAAPAPPETGTSARMISFVHRATADNISGGSTLIDHPLTNNRPNLVLIVTRNWNPGGGAGHAVDELLVSVIYSDPYWYIETSEDIDMPVGATFNVLVPAAGSHVLFQVTDELNTAYNFTVLDDPFLNSHPEYLLFVTTTYNPGGQPVMGWEHVIGVWYSESWGKWAIFNEDGQLMPPERGFNVLAVPPGPAAFVQIADAEDIVYNSTFLLHPLTVGKPSARVFISAHFSPLPGEGGVYNDHETMVAYDSFFALGPAWTIANQDHSEMPAGAAFNVLVTGGAVHLPLVYRGH